MAHNTTDLYTLTGKKIGNMITDNNMNLNQPNVTSDLYTLTGKKIGSSHIPKTDIYTLTGKKIGSTITKSIMDTIKSKL
jgi:tetrahydromethanopterin S-methyltransferase subunit G